MRDFRDFGITFRPGATGEVKTTCPKCSHTRRKKNYPCLNVNVEEGLWNCWHCSWAGTLKGGEYCGPIVTVKYRKPAEPTKSPVPDNWRKWFEKRGITPAVIERNGIFSSTVYMPQVEEEVQAIVYPYRRRGELVNLKYRDIKKNFRMHGGAERILYGIDDIGTDLLVWVEGEMDKLAVEVAGIASCVSVPDGAPAPNSKDYAKKFSFLDGETDRLAAILKHVIAVDKDGPGKRLEEELTRRLGVENCLLVQWPDGCKDANDVLVKLGPVELRRIIDSAKPCPISGVFTAGDVKERIDALYENGVARGHSTGWRSVDEYYTVRQGEWTVVTGIPGHGKSEWLDALMVNLALENDWRFAICSPENQPLEAHVQKILEKIIRKPFLCGQTQRMTEAERDAGVAWMDDHFFFVLPEEPTIDAVLERAKILVRRHGINGLVIDPWNEMEASRPGNLSETEYISATLGKLRRFAREHHIHLWIVAHPTKLQRDKATGAYPIPTLYDISGSAHWRNKADNGIVVWRDVGSASPMVSVHVQKIRFKVVGKPGKADLRYCTITGNYLEASDA